LALIITIQKKSIESTDSRVHILKQDWRDFIFKYPRFNITLKNELTFIT